MSKKLKICILLVLVLIALYVSYEVAGHLRYRALTEELKRRVAHEPIFTDPDSAEFRNVYLVKTDYNPYLWMGLQTYLATRAYDKLPTKVPPAFTEILCGEIRAKNKWGVTGYLEFIVLNVHEPRIVFPVFLSTRLWGYQTCKGKEIIYREP